MRLFLMMISCKSSQSPNWRLLQNTLYQVCYVLSRPLNANMIYWAWATEGETRLYLYQRSKTEWSDANAMRCDAIRCLKKWVNETKWKQNKLHVSDEEKQKNRQTKQKRTYKTIMTSRTKYPICADLTEQTDSNEEKIAAKLTIYDTPKHLTYKKKVRE